MNPFLAVVAKKRTAGGGPVIGSCPGDGSPSVAVATLSNDNEGYPGLTTDVFYVGQGGYVDATTRTICKVGFYFGNHHGDISTKHYNAKIWHMSGTSLGTLVTNGTSDLKTGITGFIEWVMFEWTGSKPVMNGGSTYAITMSPTEAPDTSNYAHLWADNPTSIPGSMVRWNTSGGQDAAFPTYSMNIRLYWFA